MIQHQGPTKGWSIDTDSGREEGQILLTTAGQFYYLTSGKKEVSEHVASAVGRQFGCLGILLSVLFTSRKESQRKAQVETDASSSSLQERLGQDTKNRHLGPEGIKRFKDGWNGKLVELGNGTFINMSASREDHAAIRQWCENFGVECIGFKGGQAPAPVWLEGPNYGEAIEAEAGAPLLAQMSVPPASGKTGASKQGQDVSQPAKKKGTMAVSCAVVVLVVGLILACLLGSIGLPTFIKYQKKSKAIEAPLNLKTISKGAASFYETVQYSKSGKARSPRFPKSTRWTPEKNCCEQPGQVCRGGDWDKAGWRGAGFRIDGNHHYRYRMKRSSNKKKLTITAKGDLDCDGVYAEYVINMSIENDEIISTPVFLKDSNNELE